jgi:hypothetical protein
MDRNEVGMVAYRAGRIQGVLTGLIRDDGDGYHLSDKTRAALTATVELLDHLAETRQWEALRVMSETWKVESEPEAEA